MPPADKTPNRDADPPPPSPTRYMGWEGPGDARPVAQPTTTILDLFTNEDVRTYFPDYQGELGDHAIADVDSIELTGWVGNNPLHPATQYAVKWKPGHMPRPDTVTADEIRALHRSPLFLRARRKAAKDPRCKRRWIIEEVLPFPNTEPESPEENAEGNPLVYVRWGDGTVGPTLADELDQSGLEAQHYGPKARAARMVQRFW
jgi:hypothetical protein